MGTALIQVLGAVAYGERKAYDEARTRATGSADAAERRAWRQVAAEELRHHKGFVRRLQALGADPERAMRPYVAALDRYHAAPEGDAVAQAVWSYLGEGIAQDLLRWLRGVVDGDTAAFIDTVLADEDGHEARAAAELRAVLDADPARRRRAALAAATMIGRMVGAGAPGPGPFTAFLRAGAGPTLLARLVAGYARRLGAVGLDPVSLVAR